MAAWLHRVPWRPVPYAAALVPFLVAAVRALANDWFPIGDAAQLYIRATDVFTAHHPWLGSASSASASLGFQVNNAGPLYFDLIAPFARTLPAGWGAVLGVTTINAGCLVLAGLSARRIGGVAYEGWVLAAGAVLGWTMGSELLFDMFQAHALLFPFLAACVLLSGLALGQWWVLPWLAFVLALILQTHVSYAYILPILVIAAAVSAWRHRAAMFDGDRADPRRAGRPARIAAGVLVVTWFQPVWEQLFGRGEGNLARLVRAADGTDIALGSTNAVKLTAAFVALPPWAGRHGFRSTIEPSGIAPGGDHVALAGMPSGGIAALALVVTLALLGGAWWWARRRQLAALGALATLAVVGVVGAVAAFSRLTVTELGFAPHHSRWIVVVALLVYVVLAWAGLDALSHRLGPRATRLVPAVAIGVLLVASVVNLPRYAQPHGPTADAAAMPALAAAFEQLDSAIEDGLVGDPVFFDLTNERVYAPHTSALQLHLRERGVEFRVDSEFLVRHLGERRRADGSEPTTLLQYHDVDADAVTAAPPPDECLLAAVAPTGDEPGWAQLWFAVTRAGACPAARPGRPSG